MRPPITYLDGGTARIQPLATMTANGTRPPVVMLQGPVWALPEKLYPIFFAADQLLIESLQVVAETSQYKVLALRGFWGHRCPHGLQGIHTVHLSKHKVMLQPDRKFIH